MIFIALLVGYIGFSVVKSRDRGEPEESDGNGHSMRWWMAGIIFLVSCGGLAFGADLLVSNAAIIAEKLGISQASDFHYHGGRRYQHP